MIVGALIGGGGYGGAYSAGALQGAYKLGWDPDFFLGNSVGALMAASWVARGSPTHLVKVVWPYVEEKGPRFIFNFRSLRVWVRFLFRETYLMDNDGIRELASGLDVGAILESKKWFGAVVFNRNAKKHEIFSNRDERVLKNPEVLREAIVASCSFPGLFEPVLIDGVPYSDGIECGAQPLFDLGCDKVLVFINDPEDHSNPKNDSWFSRLRGVAHELTDTRLAEETAIYKNRIIIVRVKDGIRTLSRTSFKKKEDKKGDILQALEMGFERSIQVLPLVRPEPAR